MTGAPGRRNCRANRASRLRSDVVAPRADQNAASTPRTAFRRSRRRPRRAKRCPGCTTAAKSAGGRTNASGGGPR